MELFSSLPATDINTLQNQLPYNGEVFYYGKVFNELSSPEYYNCLLNNIEWYNDQALIYGKLITTKRKVAWYGDESFNYTYSKITRKALIWTNELLELKQKIETISGEHFNSCLLNLYHTGDEGMAWHRDAEIDLKKDGAIASLSFGAERAFNFKHVKTNEKVSITLEHGSLLIMKGKTQTYWMHQIPLSKKIKTPRINLTFRTICK